MTNNTPDAPAVASAEIEFMQALLDRYSEDGGVVSLVDDWSALLAIVRRHAAALARPTTALPSEDDVERVALLPWCRHKTDCAISMNRMSTALHICDCGLASAIAAMAPERIAEQEPQ